MDFSFRKYTDLFLIQADFGEKFLKNFENGDADDVFGELTVKSLRGKRRRRVGKVKPPSPSRRSGGGLGGLIQSEIGLETVKMS